MNFAHWTGNSRLERARRPSPRGRSHVGALQLRNVAEPSSPDAPERAKRNPPTRYPLELHLCAMRVSGLSSAQWSGDFEHLAFSQYSAFPTTRHVEPWMEP